jgi:NAD(P)-dependent dehydrogenase (short-subunit alcohol dehydrogenase family)
MSGMLQDKVAIVIGAAGRDNMGQGIVREFLSQGARVIAAGRDVDELARFAADAGCDYFRADITDEAELAGLAQLAVDKHGGLDIALNATGSGLLVPFLEMTREQLEDMTRLQFVGSILFYQAMLRVMREGGSLIQISSATATIMLEDHAAYMGTKAGTEHVIRCVANEFGSRGIRANCIAPGFTITPMTERAAAKPGMLAAFEKEYPLGRVNTVEDIAKASAWVASEDCFMTGQTLQVNGGLTLRRNPTNAEIRASVIAARES